MYPQRKPIAALQPWVETLWHSRRTTMLHARELALPTGTSSLTFRLDGDPIRIWAQDQWQVFREGVLWGARTSYVVRDTSRIGGAVGVQFRPRMAAAFFGCPAGEWTGSHVPFERLGLLERLRNAADPLMALEQELLSWRPREVDGVIAWDTGETLKTPAAVRVNALRKQSGYSVRRFGTRFRDAVGLSPKLSDEFPEFGIQGPLPLGGTTFAMHLHLKDADAAHARAIAAGVTEMRAPKDEFYGERSSKLLDPFGHEWLLGHEIEKVTPEEMQRRYTEMMTSP